MATENVAVRPPARLVHLDRLKILFIAGVITAHAAMSYGAEGTWVYEEDSLSDATGLVLSVLVGGGVMFVLGLFFLMSGMLTTSPLQRRGPRWFLVSRLVRLGIPILAYALVVWPMLQWLVDKVQSKAQSLVEFSRFEFSATSWMSLGTDWVCSVPCRSGLACSPGWSSARVCHTGCRRPRSRLSRASVSE